MMRIAKARVEEVQEIKKALSDTWLDTYSSVFSPETMQKLTASWHSPEFLESQIRDSDIFFAVAKDDANKIVGLVTAQRQDKDTLVVYRLYVDPKHQRKGIGSELLKGSVSAFPKVRLIQLEVEEQNQKGISFFLKEGFVQVEVKKVLAEGVSVRVVSMEQHMP
jgi:ribosomal protein S18 acetylase RimI-like enzyme